MAIPWVSGAILGAKGSRVYASINRLSATLAYLPPAIIVPAELFNQNIIFEQLCETYCKFHSKAILQKSYGTNITLNPAKDRICE